MPKKICNVATNLVMGFLGVGKTTAILDLLNQKPALENWAVLVNEFGQIGIDGEIFSDQGVAVKEVPGGCLCCAVGLPFQVALNQILKQIRPHRLLIEPSGLGHPKQILDKLINPPFAEVLDVRAGICLLDPEQLKDSRYLLNKNFNDQIALADVLVANKLDRADDFAIQLFQRMANKISPGKAVIAQTTQAHLDIHWLDLPRDPQRRAKFPDAHLFEKESQNFINNPDKQFNVTDEIENYQSFGYVFPEQSCFDFTQLEALFKDFDVERIKGIFATERGWFLFNMVNGATTISQQKPLKNSRVTMLTADNYWHDFQLRMQQCLRKS